MAIHLLFNMLVINFKASNAEIYRLYDKTVVGANKYNIEYSFYDIQHFCYSSM